MGVFSPLSADVGDQGRRYAFQFEGNRAISAAALRRSASAELDAFVQNEGREADLEDAVFQMEITYRGKGYAFAAVSYTRTDREDIVQAVFTIAEGPRVLVENLKFTGRTATSTDSLAAFFIPSRMIFDPSKEQPFVQAELDAGVSRVRDYYLAHGYLDVKVHDPEFSFSENRTRVSITIPLSEGRLYRLTDLRFTGDLPETAAEKLRALRQEMVGNAYNRGQRLVVQSRLEEIYGNLGYAEMQVSLEEKRLPAPDGILLEAAITSGESVTINDIQVRGNIKTKSDFIRRRIKLQPGDRYTLKGERDSSRSLYRTGLFSKVDLRLENQGRPAERTLVVSVVEGPSREIYIEPGWGSYELARLKLGWREKNPWGGGRNVGIESIVSVKSRQVVANVVDPWFLNAEITADVPLYYSYREEPSFTREDIGVSPSFSRQLSDHVSATAAYNLRNTDISDVDPAAALEDIDTDSYNFASIKLQGTYDDRDDPFYPARGKRFSFGIEHADNALGGDITFTRLTAGMRYFYSFGRETVLGLRYATGFIYPGSDETTVPISERFFNGGENSVRSFRQSELGPKDLSGDPVGGLAYNTINIELRRRLIGDLSGSLFFDLGNVAPNRSISESDGEPPENRSDAVSDTLHDFFSDFRPGIGIGLQYKLPIGPVRCDLAFNPDADDDRDEDEYVFHFSVGMAF
ncbi:MAG: outer membrane protein assembly factor BamA [Desulfobacteraceae bacterium]|nr:outer membrane protein assembly factor BamA [Desulfobacteraceae bacterium]MBC2750566.1 outer membrane protein assembly factor BamA [Desulfobacteraceae bacterium]